MRARRRFLDAVPLAEAHAPSRGQSCDHIAASPLHLKSVGVESMRRILEHDSGEFKKKVEAHVSCVKNVKLLREVPI